MVKNLKILAHDELCKSLTFPRLAIVVVPHVQVPVRMVLYNLYSVLTEKLRVAIQSSHSIREAIFRSRKQAHKARKMR